MRFSKSHEGLKQFVADFRGDAGAGVFDFGDDFLFRHLKTQEDFPAMQHHIGGVVNEIMKNAVQPAGIKRQRNGWRRVGHFDLCGFEFGFGAEIANQFKDESTIIRWPTSGLRAFALGEDKDVADHVADAFDLPADAELGFGADFRANVGQVEHFGGEPDDAQRIFQVMNNGLRETADEREAFGLNHFPHMQLVEFAQAVADLPQQAERERG